MQISKAELKKRLPVVVKRIREQHAQLDTDIASIPSVCSKGCSACCHQMVSAHTWEEESILAYLPTIHAATQKVMRKQLIDWWRYWRSIVRRATPTDPLDLAEMRQASLRIIQDRIPCPLLVDGSCSIYPVRPAMCRAHVVTNEPARCTRDPGRDGDSRAHPLVWKALSPQTLDPNYYPHFMKPLAYSIVTHFRVAAQSTPVMALLLDELIPKTE